MSKDKKTNAGEQPRLGDFAFNEGATGGGEVSGNALTSAGGAPPEPPKAQPIRKSWSSPIQAMARIEQLMNDLDERQQKIVGSWFVSTYVPELIEQSP